MSRKRQLGRLNHGRYQGKIHEVNITRNVLMQYYAISRTGRRRRLFAAVLRVIEKDLAQAESMMKRGK